MDGKEKQWYVVHTYSGYEERVKKNLEQRIKSMDTGDEILQVVIPTEDEIEVRGGQRRTVTRKILPGYVLVEMKLITPAQLAQALQEQMGEEEGAEQNPPQ